MKNTLISLISLLFFTVVGLAVFTSGSESIEASGELKLAVSILPDKYLLGQKVPVDIKVTNTSNKTILLHGDTSLKIASGDSGEFRLYAPMVKFYALDGVEIPIALAPGESVSFSKTILWNSKPAVKHLNEDVAQREKEGRILTDYALPESGTYLIKALVAFHYDKKSVVVESAPFRITVIEPQGEDREVWDKIKNNGEFAYFIQEGDITRGYKKPEERAKFQQELQDILNNYPNSFYAEPLRRSLDKFRASETKRQEFLDKLQNKNHNE